MSWYRTGTISLTNGSTAVTGSGTDFIAGAAVGESLAAPDGKVYEISAVVSATALTLGSAYLGSTASGQAYAIAPTQSYIRDLAAQAASLVNSYSAVVTGAGAGKFPNGTVGVPSIRFTTDDDTGVNHSAANSLDLVAGGVAQANISATNGLTALVLKVRNAANTFTNWFTSATTAARTWTMPDKDGTVAMTSDVAAVTPTTLGLVIGTNVQAYDADLTTWAVITPGANVGTFLATPTFANLNTAVTDADLVSLAGSETLTNKTLTSPVINTPTGIVKGDVGLGNVENTSDANKPVSTAQALADTAIGSAAAADATSKANAAIVIAEAYADALSVSVVKLNPRIVTSNLTIASTYNAASVGPITVAEGITVTVSDNATWSIN